ncbi:uncharacterized protein LOC132632290 [Lycium barbarum]|uniref:uncharacterized protein LOC132632290 n=1 Tax=Lycium barbarum TaxID=112863 RepID=UPI00293F709F|nr:uncharacterized protein LOC132632290 [Lycium barbarum]
MKFTCLSEGKGYYFPPCHIVNISGFRVLLDCPLDLSALAVFSPLPIVTSSLLDEETSNHRGQSSSNSESIRREVGESLDSKILIQAEPWYKTVTSLQLWSIYSIDVVLISSAMGMLGLPFVTRLKDFRAKIYATEAASKLGKLMMEDLVSMHMELRQFYGPEESGCPQWMTWEKLELLPTALKDIVLGIEGTELGGWMSIYSAADIKDCMEKVQFLKYFEEACYNGSLTIKAFSSGLEIGACNWKILSPKGSLTYLSGSVFASITASSFDYKALEGSDVLLYSDFTACNDVDGEKNDFPPAAARSYPCDTGSGRETESLIDSDEYSEEMEKVSFVCSHALNSINDGGSVLIPMGRPGVMLQLLEHISLLLESSNLKVPIYFVSSVAEELLEFFNIIPEWLSSQRQERFYAGQPLFTHIQLSNEKKLLVSPAIHSSKFLTSWQEPCIVFCPHWSLRLGPAVHLLQRWCADPNSLLIMEEGADINLTFLPFKPMSMKVLQCSFISGIRLKNTIPLLKILQPKRVLVPERLRPHISCWNLKFSVCYFSGNETVVMPKLNNYADMDIAMDLTSELINYTKLIQENNTARLKGELLLEQGKHRLVLGSKQVLSSQDRPLLFLGRVELDSLLMALKKMGMKATVQDAQSTDGSENVSTVCISEPNEALIVITATRTMISVADETTASLISEAVRSTSIFI